MPASKRNSLIVAAAVVAALALGYARYREIGPFSPPSLPAWWAKSWVGEGGPESPSLDLGVRERGEIIGQLVTPYQGGYRLSQSVLSAEIAPDEQSVLLTIEPRPAAGAEAGAYAPGFGKPLAPASPPELYLLVRRAEARAELFRLADPPGEARVVRPLSPTSKPVVFPSEVEKYHTRIASLAAAPGKRP